ncbi:ArsA family ATPase [Salirhabdus sp. Marseille-P4669]|uniref:ArsA family ATPase n=1 Tax=Salirhabdus sp. Marseille-P4669 TaxID=2042310 RepID=UPI000C7CF2D9|nr:ArsA family ATPase [Salirhabdus sp. Marseille-P4669]
MSTLKNKKIIFVGGKGGVGKSTSSAALALAFSRTGQKTLIISTDPAHNLGDIFHQKLKNEKKQLAKNLWGIEIDPVQESKRYIDTVKDNLKGLVKSTMVQEVHRQIDMASAAPGADEAALFDRIVSIILEEKDNFDKIIFDTAPTGHTIRLLSLPEIMSVWIDGLIERRQKINTNYSQLLNDGEPVEDPIYEVLQKRKDKFKAVREIILDGSVTGFTFVLIPERLPILETEKAIKQLDQYHLHTRTLIVNKVLPDYADGAFLSKRRAQEQDYLQQIDKTFSKQTLLRIPLFEEDIFDQEKLEIFANHIEQSLKEVHS